MQQKARNMPYRKTLIKPKSLLWGGDCLELFALNVSTFFATMIFNHFAKDLRTLLTGRSNPIKMLAHFGVFIPTIK